LQSPASAATSASCGIADRSRGRPRERRPVRGLALALAFIPVARHLPDAALRTPPGQCTFFLAADARVLLRGRHKRSRRRPSQARALPGGRPHRQRARRLRERVPIRVDSTAAFAPRVAVRGLPRTDARTHPRVPREVREVRHGMAEAQHATLLNCSSI
jgi:hypothetical protein